MSKINFHCSPDGIDSVSICSTSGIEPSINVEVSMDTITNLLGALNYYWYDFDMTEEQEKKLVDICRYIVKEDENEYD